MKTGTVTIKNFSGGWINDFTKGSTVSAYQTKENTYYSGLANFNKPNYLGQIAPTFGENPGTAGVTSLCVNATKASDDNGYFIQTNGLISKRSLVGSFPINFTGLDYTAPTGCLNDAYKDIWNHVTIAGVESTFFTYQTASNAYVGYRELGGARNDTYFTLTYRNVPHVGGVSVANQSYISDGNYIQAYNPNAASPFGVRTNVGSGWTIVSIADYGNYVAAVGNNGNSSRMWLWNGTSTDPNFQYDIRDTTVTAIVNEGGQLRVFTYGKNNTTKIKTFSSSGTTGFSEEADWETPTSLCSSPSHGMVDVWLNQIVWKTTDGYIWTYGSVRKNELNTGAHRVGIVTTSGSVSSGCVKNLYTDNLYVSVQSGANFYIYDVKADTSYGSSISSSLKTALYELPHYSTINKIRVYFSKFQTYISGASDALSISLYDGYGTTDLLGYSVPNNLSDALITYHPIKRSIAGLDCFYLNMTFTGCIIKKIEVDYAFDDSI